MSNTETTRRELKRHGITSITEGSVLLLGTVTLTDNTAEEFGRVLTTADMRGYLLWGRVSDSPKLSVNFSGELEGFALKYSHLNRM